MSRKAWLQLVLPLIGLSVLFWLLAFAPSEKHHQPPLLELSVILRDGDGAVSTMRKGMEQAAQDLNVELRFLIPAEDNSAVQQAQLLEREVAGAAPAVLLIPADREALGDAVSAAAGKTTLVTVETDMTAWGAAASITMDHQALGAALGAAALNGVPEGGTVLLLDSLPGKGVVGVCEQATHSGDAPKVLELAHRYPWVVAAVGIHPESLLPAADCGEEGPAPTVSVYGGDWAAEMQALMPYYNDPKVVAVGECGLDYHWPVPKDAQLALFEAEIRLALELDKPIIVHDRQAHADVYALLKKYRPKGIVHCYSGSADDAVWLAQQGLYIGFGGACTFQGAKRAAKAIAALPLEAIVLETDCPYMAPEPVRGTRCDSSLIRYVGEYIAQLKGISAEEVFRTTAENARRVYGL